MANMFDYLKWRGDLPFGRDPLNAVDALIFSTLAYVSFTQRTEGGPENAVTLREASEAFFAQDNLEYRYLVKHDLNLLREAAETTRFGETKLCRYRDELVPEKETQFAAMTFLLDDGTAFLAFRGTDYTLVGWKEDFNMCFQQTIPAQRLAAQYVRDVAAELEVPLHLGGHSKGGNLAVFAAARSSPMTQARILDVYNNDGPGFDSYLMGDPGYLAMVPKIHTFVPQSSVIGMLLEHEEPYTVIKSKSVGVMQHAPYSWEVLGKAFIPMEEVSQSSQFLDATIKQWLSDMPKEERLQLVEVLYSLLSTGGVDRALDIFQPKNLRVYLKTLGANPDLRRVLSTEFLVLIEAAKKTRQKFSEQKNLPAPSEEKE